MKFSLAAGLKKKKINFKAVNLFKKIEEAISFNVWLKSKTADLTSSNKLHPEIHSADLERCIEFYKILWFTHTRGFRSGPRRMLHLRMEILAIAT